MARETNTDEKTDIYHVDEVDTGAFPCLQLVTTAARGARFPLHSGKNLIGRSELADVRVDDSSVSREHAEVEVRAEGAVVSDLGSRNGTEVQGATIQSATPLTHGQRLKVGIYDFQYLTEPAALPAEDDVAAPESAAPETEAPPPSEEPASPEAPPVAEEPQAPAPPVAEAPPPAEAPSPAEEAEAPEVSAAAPGLRGRLLSLLPLVQRYRRLGVIVAAGVLVVGLAWFGVSQWMGPDAEGPPVVPLPPPSGVAPEAAPAVVAVPKPEYIPVFLDFTATPISADVYFGDEKVGSTPFRMSAHLQHGKTYEVRAEFKLEELGETIEERLRFSLAGDEQVIPLEFAGPVGHVKMKSLPHGVDIYLEGTFAHDPHRSKPIKFNELSFGKPIYLPHGHYVLELKQSRQLASSQTFIREVAYRREFKINKDNPTYTIDLSDKDLKIFPVTLRSKPAGADVIIDEEKKGVTPFAGELGIGEHTLVLRKEGYFEHKQSMRVDLNTPFLAEIELKTSEAGSRINDARVRLRQQRYDEAINLLIDSMKVQPTPLEVAEAHYLIGQAYLEQGAFAEARDYFTQAMQHEMYRYPGRLGIADLYFRQGERIKALQVLVEVLLSAKRGDVISDAAKLFQSISPFKSVLYIASEPKGARVTVNDREVAVSSPLILHDLMVGVYRIQFSLAGYETQTQRVELGVSEFKPVVVQMRPIAPK